MNDFDEYIPEFDEPYSGADESYPGAGGGADDNGPAVPEPLHPINWDLLDADDAEAEWLELNRWVNWLRHTYGLPTTIIPPYWHRHTELVWELSALHLHWIDTYGRNQNGSAPFGWHRDFADARERLRDWVAASGTRLGRDRPTRQTYWPGEQQVSEPNETVISNRDEDFVQFVADDVSRRRQAETDFDAQRVRPHEDTVPGRGV